MKNLFDNDKIKKNNFFLKEMIYLEYVKRVR